MLIIVLLVVVFFTGHSFGYSEGLKWREDLNISFKKLDEAWLIEKTLIDNPPPECSANDCPEYSAEDVDGDGHLESIVLERTAMTQQAGRIWIIKKGRVVFKSKEHAQVGFSPIDKTGNNTNGFIVHYNTAFQLADNFLDSFKADYYRFYDGKFVLDKTVNVPKSKTLGKE